MKTSAFLSSLLAGALLVTTPLLVPVQAAPVASVQNSGDQTAALRQLTSGVQEIAAPGLTGVVSTFSPGAFPVAAGKAGKEARACVVAAAFAGRARIVAFGHDGYLLADGLKTADTGRLMDNSLAWVSGGNKPATVGVIAKGNDVVNALTARGIRAVAATTSNLAPYSTLVVNGHALSNQDLAPLQAYLERGGGLVIATTGWGWNYNEPNLDLTTDYVGNQLLAPYGLVWTMGQAGKTTPNGIKVEPLSPLLNASNALKAVSAQTALSPTENEQISNALGDLMTGLPTNDTLIFPQLKQLADGANGEVVPFERRPVKTDNPTARLMLTLQTGLSKNLPVTEVKANPAGVIFPGDVPPNAKPITKTSSIDTSVPDWHSMGLYAAPGVPITVKLPDGVDPKGISVRIGCHKDTLWHLDTWKRAPEITRSIALQKGETKFANPFGGLVYIVVPSNATSKDVDVTVSGAYDAPLFVQGETDVTQWKNSIRWAPSPWAEIATDKIILTVPSRSVRDLDDPIALCDYYNKCMDAAADLYGIPRDRKRPERIVADVQISAGYMHSGYPIMTWLDVEKSTVDLEKLKTAYWGHWHEVGHNHQQSDWTFPGTGEVTNNLLPMYVATEILGAPVDSGHPALKPAEVAKRWAKYTEDGRQFKDWQSSPFLALDMYIQLQKAFGWAPFKKVFAEYRTLSDAQRPKTEEQKHDQWMVRMSRATGKNLGPFFVKWGVPTSQAARDSIQNLPEWMPAFPTIGIPTQIAQVSNK